MEMSAAGDFLRQEYVPLCRYVYRVIGNREDTVELVQEACLRFCEMQSRARGEQHERALLFRIARNLAIDLLRKRSVRAAHEKEAGPGNLVVLHPEESPEQRLLDKERHQIFQAVLAQLNEHQRECLLLRGSGLSYREIAAELRLNPESIGPTLVRALRKFRSLYEELVENRTGFAGEARSQRR
jgi:RNA polymerase sigma-70 factor (ECF subfamily)